MSPAPPTGPATTLQMWGGVLEPGRAGAPRATSISIHRGPCAPFINTRRKIQREQADLHPDPQLLYFASRPYTSGTLGGKPGDEVNLLANPPDLGHFSNRPLSGAFFCTLIIRPPDVLYNTSIWRTEDCASPGRAAIEKPRAHGKL